MMMNEKTIKIIGITTTVIGMGASLIGGWVCEKQTDDKIAQKVQEAIANLKKE